VRQPVGESLIRRLLFCCIAVLVATSFTALAQTPGPQGEPRGSSREQIHLVPFAPDIGVDGLMHVIVHRPHGDGPHRLAIINHGSPRSASDRADFVSRFSAASAWFLERGFAVALPTRRGYGPTGGDFSEHYGRCDSPDYHAGGLATAQDIRSALLYMRRQSFVDPNRIVLVGQSAGGWGVLASAGQGLPGVVAIVNFAGGRGSRGPDNVCSSSVLVRAALRFGEGVNVPVLSIYTANDSFFNPSLARQMHEAFVAGGASRARLVQLSAFSQDGHGLFGHRDGPDFWGPHVEPFLREFALAR
jgi:dienelactone hydrolase